jgi:hypothetical protein
MPKSKKSSKKAVKKVVTPKIQKSEYHIHHTQQKSIVALLITLVILMSSYMLLVLSMPKMTKDYETDLTRPAGFTKGEFIVQMVDQNSSGQFGNVSLREIDGQTLVQVNLNNSPRGVSQPAYIHVGSCIDLGPAQYPLNPVVNGKSETIIKTTLESLRSASPLAVNVVSSAARVDRHVSCGNLPF